MPLRRARCALHRVGIDAGMWGCRVVAGYTRHCAGNGGDGVWLGMVLDWAVRGVLFYCRMVSGRWLWKYPRSKIQVDET